MRGANPQAKVREEEVVTRLVRGRDEVGSLTQGKGGRATVSSRQGWRQRRVQSLRAASRSTTCHVARYHLRGIEGKSRGPFWYTKRVPPVPPYSIKKLARDHSRASIFYLALFGASPTRLLPGPRSPHRLWDTRTVVWYLPRCYPHNYCQAGSSRSHCRPQSK